MMKSTRCAATFATAAGLCSLSITACSGPRATSTAGASSPTPTPAQPNPAPDAAWQGAESPMAWWRDARFGMFIHWGLYSIPAGEWPGKGTGHAEWIRDSAQIPVGEYEKLRDQFNPVKFDANAWTAAAKQAGMKYICITTKHHDGFCLFDTKQTGGGDWSISHTPFKRDIMKEMADACRAQGVVPCWYHSIMDWHHPDYLPRRPWEAATRTAEGADFERFNTYLKNQVTELLTNYGPIGVMWFDGQWEGTWTHPRGEELYKLCKQLQPRVIVNNRVDKGGGNFGMTRTDGGVQYFGDYGTPEQEIPPTGMPGVDWETCMTMNDHWGYNKVDHNFKSTADLLHKLADIASKGGNFLLNVGPTAAGEIPAESIQRLKEIGAWMNTNGEAIHGTQAGPFEKLSWGRCTQKPYNAGVAAGRAGNAKSATRLYLHVFNWPADGKLVVPGLYNKPREAFLLSDKGRNLTITRGGIDGDSLIVDVPSTAPDAINSVVVLDIEGKPDVATLPRIEAAANIFVTSLNVRLITDQPSVDLHYTLDGSVPTASSPKFVWQVDNGIRTAEVNIDRTTTIGARAFRNGKPVSPISLRTFTKVTPIPAITTAAKTPGMTYFYHEGDWNTVPGFTSMKPAAMGIATAFDRSQRPAARQDKFGFRYHGYLRVPKDGAYTFWTASDDGSNLYVDGQRVVNNDGLHSLEEKSGTVALAAGLHAITVDFFEKGGGHELVCWYAGPGILRKKLDPKELVTEP